jgi:hypothetical protein
VGLPRWRVIRKACGHAARCAGYRPEDVVMFPLFFVAVGVALAMKLGRTRHFAR